MTILSFGLWLISFQTSNSLQSKNDGGDRLRFTFYDEKSLLEWAPKEYKLKSIQSSDAPSDASTISPPTPTLADDGFQVFDNILSTQLLTTATEDIDSRKTFAETGNYVEKHIWPVLMRKITKELPQCHRVVPSLGTSGSNKKEDIPGTTTTNTSTPVNCARLTTKTECEEREKECKWNKIVGFVLHGESHGPMETLSDEEYEVFESLAESRTRYRETSVFNSTLRNAIGGEAFEAKQVWYTTEDIHDPTLYKRHEASEEPWVNEKVLNSTNGWLGFPAFHTEVDHNSRSRDIFDKVYGEYICVEGKRLLKPWEQCQLEGYLGPSYNFWTMIETTPLTSAPLAFVSKADGAQDTAVIAGTQPGQVVMFQSDVVRHSQLNVMESKEGGGGQTEMEKVNKRRSADLRAFAVFEEDPWMLERPLKEEFTEWGECSSICGEGSQWRQRLNYQIYGMDDLDVHQLCYHWDDTKCAGEPGKLEITWPMNEANADEGDKYLYRGEHIYTGAHKSVFKVWKKHPRTGRFTIYGALKQFNPIQSKDHEASESTNNNTTSPSNNITTLDHEIEMAKKLAHVHGVAKILAVVEEKDIKQKSIVMEMLGADLTVTHKHMLENRNIHGSPYTYPTILYFLHELLGTLKQMKELGYVHSDIGPTNVLTQASFEAKGRDGAAKEEEFRLFHLSDLNLVEKRGGQQANIGESLPCLPYKGDMKYAPWRYFLANLEEGGKANFCFGFADDVERLFLLAVDLFHDLDAWNDKTLPSASFDYDEGKLTYSRLNTTTLGALTKPDAQVLCANELREFASLCAKLFAHIYGLTPGEAPDYEALRGWVLEELKEVFKGEGDLGFEDLMSEKRKTDEWFKNFELGKRDGERQLEHAGGEFDYDEDESEFHYNLVHRAGPMVDSDGNVSHRLIVLLNEENEEKFEDEREDYRPALEKASTFMRDVVGLDVEPHIVNLVNFEDPGDVTEVLGCEEAPCISMEHEGQWLTRSSRPETDLRDEHDTIKYIFRVLDSDHQEDFGFDGDQIPNNEAGSGGEEL